MGEIIMAKLTMTYFSNALHRTVDVQVILPVDAFDYGSGNYIDKPQFKTLYLLHGIFGSNSDWINNTRIMMYASEHNLAVVMPSGENSFYVNNPLSNENYAKFIGEELVNITRASFPLSKRKEDTFIAGLSMGGFGALRNGIEYYDTFSVIGGFSSAIPGQEDSKDIFVENDFGMRYHALVESNPESFNLYDITLKHKGTLPYIYLTCGTEDFIYQKSVDYRDFLTNQGITFEYHEWQGEHSWTFWDESILKFLKFLKSR